MKRVLLILGGGFGGIATAVALRAQLDPAEATYSQSWGSGTEPKPWRMPLVPAISHRPRPNSTRQARVSRRRRGAAW